MKNTIQRLTIATALLFAAIVSGCAVQTERSPRALYDFGMLLPAQNVAASEVLPPLSVAQVNVPPWLDSRMMYYRLAYANDQQPHPYATSRWNTPPGQLFEQRLKARLGQAGGVVLSTSDGVTDVPVLRVEVDDFIQIFHNPGQSIVSVNVRASILDGRKLVAHKTFTRQLPAPTADASGGAEALADASDAIINDMMNWLAGLQLKK